MTHSKHKHECKVSFSFWQSCLIISYFPSLLFLWCRTSSTTASTGNRVYVFFSVIQTRLVCSVRHRSLSLIPEFSPSSNVVVFLLYARSVSIERFTCLFRVIIIITTYYFSMRIKSRVCRYMHIKSILLKEKQPLSRLYLLVYNALDMHASVSILAQIS